MTAQYSGVTGSTLFRVHPGQDTPKVRWVGGLVGASWALTHPFLRLQRPALHPGLPPEHLRRRAGREPPQPHPPVNATKAHEHGPQEVPRLDCEDLPGEHHAGAEGP